MELGGFRLDKPSTGCILRVSCLFHGYMSTDVGGESQATLRNLLYPGYQNDFSMVLKKIEERQSPEPGLGLQCQNERKH